MCEVPIIIPYPMAEPSVGARILGWTSVLMPGPLCVMLSPHSSGPEKLNTQEYRDVLYT